MLRISARVERLASENLVQRFGGDAQRIVVATTK
jgi:hypothetical protein